MAAGFHGNVTNNEIFDPILKKGQILCMDQELPERITVVIRLSNARQIDTIKDMLEQSLEDFGCQERGTVITVSRCPRSTDFDVLTIVQKYDSGAVEI